MEFLIGFMILTITSLFMQWLFLHSVDRLKLPEFDMFTIGFMTSPTTHVIIYIIVYFFNL